MYRWRKWFAWYPVIMRRTYDEKVWLEFVERRYDKFLDWQYRPKTALDLPGEPR